MPTLKEILAKEKAVFVSVIKEGKAVTHVKGFTANSDVKVGKGDKYWVKVAGKETEEETMR